MNKTVVILSFCILLNVFSIVRCDDDVDEEVEESDIDDSNFEKFGEYDPPTKEYATDAKIISRNVKCLGRKSFTNEIKIQTKFFIRNFFFSSSLVHQCAKQQYWKCKMLSKKLILAKRLKWADFEWIPMDSLKWNRFNIPSLKHIWLNSWTQYVSIESNSQKNDEDNERIFVGKTMEDYAKARHKTTRKLLVLKMVTDSGTMNPLMSSVDFVQDGDLNKSLEHFVSHSKSVEKNHSSYEFHFNSVSKYWRITKRQF